MTFIAVLRDVLSRPEDAHAHKPPTLYHSPPASASSFGSQTPYKDRDDDSDADMVDESRVTKISAEDIRPDITAANSMSVALQEISTCKGMFDKWADELDRTASSRRDSDGLEDELIAAVDELRDQASLSLEASATILRDHETFAQEMAVLLESAAGSPTGDFYRPMEAMAVGDNIVMQSEKLALHSMEMQSQLDNVLSLVDRIKRKHDRKLLWRKVWSWLVKAFNVLAAVLAVGAFVLPILHPIGVIGSAALGAGATLATAAAAVCKDLSDSDDEEYKFKCMIDFLRFQVPKEAARAKRSLQTFQACHRVMQIDIKMQNGECVRISQYDAEKAKDQWKAHRLSLARINQDFQASRSGHGY